MRDYNPLSVKELGRNTARALMGHPSVRLPLDEPFDGAGVYTLHYSGNFAPYSDMDDKEPIYVGKASLPGGREGKAAKKQFPLWRRLCEHSESIQSVKNLDSADFRYRWLNLEHVWIGLVEQTLIVEYRPVWNTVIKGFGIHDPGRGRNEQKRTRLDTLHPGRPLAAGLKDGKESADELVRLVTAHRGRTS